MPLIERFSRLMHPDTEAEWCNELFHLGNHLGFERTLVALVVKPAQKLEDAFLRSNYAPEWRDNYDRNKLAYYDPTVAHCIAKNTSLLWSPDIFLSREQKQMYEAASSYGLRSGVTLPIHGPKGELGILCFVNDRYPGKAFRKDLDKILPDLSLLRDVVFDTGLSFCVPPNSCLPIPKLTPRELECLKWTAAGKTTWEISKILRCSQSVVNFHITNVRGKLGVGSRRDAVVKSLRLGLIDLD
jgi:LuxR family transcriptional regulator, quorum-sensing system regulator LasR